MPLSKIHLTNMLAAHEAGATIMPACPGFYHRPEKIDDLVDMVVARVLDHLGSITRSQNAGVVTMREFIEKMRKEGLVVDVN